MANTDVTVWYDVQTPLNLWQKHPVLWDFAHKLTSTNNTKMPIVWQQIAAGKDRDKTAGNVMFIHVLFFQNTLPCSVILSLVSTNGLRGRATLRDL